MSLASEGAVGVKAAREREHEFLGNKGEEGVSKDAGQEIHIGGFRRLGNLLSEEMQLSWRSRMPAGPFCSWLCKPRS